MISDRSDCEAAANAANALHDTSTVLKNLHQIVEATNRKAEYLCNNIDTFTPKERFEASFELWRRMSKISTATMWLEIHTGTARRHVNTLLSEMVVFEDDDK